MTSRLAAFLLAICWLAAGCQRAVDAPFDPDLKVSSVPVPSGLSATVHDRRVDLSWTLSPAELASVRRYLVYRSDTTADRFALADSTAVASFTDRSVANEVRYFYRVSVRNLAGVEGHKSSSVSCIPTLFAVRINSDSLYTASVSVRLELTAAGAAFMRLANDTLQPGAWQPFRSTLSWLLEPGAGLKTVYAQFRMSGGVESSGWISDRITLDDRAEITSVTLSDSVLAPGDTLAIFVATGEAGGAATYSLAGRSNVPLFDDGAGIDLAAGDGIYSGVFVARETELFEQRVLEADFRDRAGNQAQRTPGPAKISVRRPPDAPVWVAILPEPDDHSTLLLSWTVTEASPFGQLVLRRASSPAAGLAAPVIKTFTSPTTTHRDTGLAAARTYYYTVEVVLSNGLTALSAERSAVTNADLPPDPVDWLSPSDLRYDRVALEWTRAKAADFAGYRLHRAASPLVTRDSLLLHGSASVTATTFTDTTVRGGTIYHYRVFVLDRAGQAAGSESLRVAVPVNLPPDPVTVAVIPRADSSLQLGWTRSEADDFASYRIFKADSATLLSTPPDSLLVGIKTSRDSTSYIEVGLAQRYYYRVFVHDRGGLSSGSNVVWGPKVFGP